MALLAAALLLALFRLGGGTVCEGGIRSSPPPGRRGLRIPVHRLAAAGGMLLPGPMAGSAESVHALEVLRGGWMGQPDPGRGSDWDEPHQGPGHHRRSYGHPRRPGAQYWRPAGPPYPAGRMRQAVSSSGATSRGASRHNSLIIRSARCTVVSHELSVMTGRIARRLPTLQSEVSLFSIEQGCGTGGLRAANHRLLRVGWSWREHQDPAGQLPLPHRRGLREFRHRRSRHGRAQSIQRRGALVECRHHCAHTAPRAFGALAYASGRAAVVKAWLDSRDVERAWSGA